MHDRCQLEFEVEQLSSVSELDTINLAAAAAVLPQLAIEAAL